MSQKRIERLSRHERPIPTLIAGPAMQAVYDWLGANRELLVGDFAAAEVASALSRLVRMGRLDSADAFARLADCRAT